MTQRPRPLALAVLIIAALSSIATSQPRYPPAQVYDEASGTSVITATDSRARLHVIVTASRAAVSAARPAGGIVGVETRTTAGRRAERAIEVRVVPTAPTADPRIATARDPDAPALSLGYVPFSSCDTDPCRVRHTIEVIRRPGSPESFEVFWAVRAAIVFEDARQRPPPGSSIGVAVTVDP